MSDVGKHYRYEWTFHALEGMVEDGQITVKMDPYRICNIYNVGGGPREHMLKKLLRGTEKGHTERDLIEELQCCLTRWSEMLYE